MDNDNEENHSEQFKFACPHCGQHLEAEPTWVGMECECPECGKMLIVPPPQETHELKFEMVCETEAEKPTFEKWLTQNLRGFFSFERPEETDFSRFADAASTFEFSRLFPLAVICLGFGWLMNWISNWQDLWIVSHADDSRWGIIPIAALALYGAFRAICHFLRPKGFQWGAWIATCLFSAVAGVLLLLAFQSIAVWAVEAWAEGTFRPRNILMLGVIFIGLCYEWVSNPNSALIAKFIGFVGGVGFCEEATKLLPICLLVLNRRKLPFKLDFSLRSLLMLGFFSGLGFGIGEALSMEQYALPNNDDFASQLCRWFACVPSHAIYTVVDTAFLWMFHRQIAQAEKVREKVGWFALCVAAVALLHGIYDTLCELPLPFMGPVLDAASLVLMWKVVRYTANHSASVEDRKYSGLEDFNTSLPIT